MEYLLIYSPWQTVASGVATLPVPELALEAKGEVHFRVEGARIVPLAKTKKSS